MAGRGAPFVWQIVKAVPVNPRGSSEQKVRSLFYAPGLNLFRTEARNAGLGHPDGHMGDVLDFLQLGRPFVDLPEIPVERKAVNGKRIDMVEDPLALEIADEVRIDRRN